MTSHWSRLYFMTFYIVTMVRAVQSHSVVQIWLQNPPRRLWLFIFTMCPFSLQVVMTIIVAFILDAFVFRMNYSRKNREPLENPEGGVTFILTHSVGTWISGDLTSFWKNEFKSTSMSSDVLWCLQEILNVLSVSYKNNSFKGLLELESTPQCDFSDKAPGELVFSESWAGLISPCVHALDENGIVFEVEVSRDEALATLELYKQTCPGQSSLSSLQGVLQAMDRGGVRTHTHTHQTLCPLLFTQSLANWLFLPLWRAALVSCVPRS